MLSATSSGRTVFLTGASGFIGSRLLTRLAARGDRLRCWLRDSSRAEPLERLGAEIVRGELDDTDALARAMVDADLAYHLAAVYDVGVVDAGAMDHVNVGGTRSFLAAAERAGVPLSVHVSSTVALGPVATGIGDETTEHGPHFLSAYERSKVAAHRLAREAQTRGLPLIIACPGNVYGPGDEGPNARYIRDVLRGRVPGLPTRPAWFSYVHVDDVAEGLVLLGTRGRAGETYVLSGEGRSLNDFTRAVAELGGKRAPRLRFPAGAIHWTGVVLDAVSRLTGARFPVTRETADTAAGLRWLHSHDKATRELGWNPRPLAEGLPGTIAWFRGGAAEP